MFRSNDSKLSIWSPYKNRNAVCMCVNTHVNKLLMKAIWSFFSSRNDLYASQFIRLSTREISNDSIVDLVEWFRFEEMICVNPFHYGSLLSKLIVVHCFRSCRIWLGHSQEIIQNIWLTHYHIIFRQCQHSFFRRLIQARDPWPTFN